MQHSIYVMCEFTQKRFDLKFKLQMHLKMGLKTKEEIRSTWNSARPGQSFFPRPRNSFLLLGQGPSGCPLLSSILSLQWLTGGAHPSGLPLPPATASLPFAVHKPQPRTPLPPLSHTFPHALASFVEHPSQSRHPSLHFATSLPLPSLETT